MKILHVTKKYPHALGGDAVVVANLQKHQEAAGHQVSILTSNCLEIVEGRRIYKFGLRDTPAALDTITLKRLVSLVALACKAFFVLLKERPDVIHTHSIDMAFCISFAARLFKTPVVHTFHIVTFYDQQQPAIRRKAELWFARHAGLRTITAPNAHDVAALKDAGLSQAVLLPNGVDVEFWRPDPGSAKNDLFTFVSIGRLEQQKGYEYLIRAASLLARASSLPFQVIIVGEGSQKERLQRLARMHGVQGMVRFVGRKTPKQIRAQLTRADAAIFASLYETTPLTLLEAWAVGVPVIMTPVGIVRGATETTSQVYLVQQQNEQSLMSAMQRCMTDEASRATVAAAGHKEAQKYAWPGIGRIAETIYGSVR